MKLETFIKGDKVRCTMITLAISLASACVASPAADKKTPVQTPKAAVAKPATSPVKPAGGGVPGHSPAGGGSLANHPPSTAKKPVTTESVDKQGQQGKQGEQTTQGEPAGRGKGEDARQGPNSRPVPAGSKTRTLPGGNSIQTRSNGKISDVHDVKHSMDIHHGLDGSRRISVQRRDGSRLVAERGRRGYVERGYRFHDHDYARRSYYYRGREYDRYYRGYYYGGAGGVYMNVYAPAYYYGPGFYGWAYNPWALPISYGWGWAGSPWYGFYSGFFTPYTVYTSAAFWLTDYIISADLQAAYAAHAELPAAAVEAAAAPTPVSPEVKQMISDEIKGQLALENAEAQQNRQQQEVDPASSGIERLLGDGHPHVFVVGGELDLTDASGRECAVSDGDALQLLIAPPPNAAVANLVVLASKGGRECQISNTVSVQVSDLQEMQNHMRETIDQGLQELQAKQGKDGLPAAPPSAQAKPTQTQFAAIAPPPDPKDATDIQAQSQQADQSESEVAVAAAQESGSPVGAVSSVQPTVTLGQSKDEVIAILGKPTKTADTGAKQIHYYDQMKVIFKAGKVSDVE